MTAIFDGGKILTDAHFNEENTDEQHLRLPVLSIYYRKLLIGKILTDCYIAQCHICQYFHQSKLALYGIGTLF